MNTAAIVVALAASALFALAASLSVRLLPPRHSTWLISVGAVASALSATVVLALVGLALVGQLPLFAEEGQWSTSALHDHAPTEPGVGVVSLVLLLAAAAAVLFVGCRQGLALRAAYRACEGMSVGTGELVVLREAPAKAVAVPGRPGRIVVGESLLAALSANERRALLAHEHAHLEHGHHWHRSAVVLAAAANPLLAPLRSAIVYATERWADEQAATEVGDRRHVATALARAALLTRSPVPAFGQLAIAAQAVPDRVAAMLARPSRPRPVLTAAVLALPLLGAVAAAIVWDDTEDLFELAGRVYRAGHGG
jgi:Zn-dependent protease with chaperone function